MITIPAAANSYSLDQLTITNDNDNEPQESFSLVITEVSTGTISTAIVTVDILDDDNPVPLTDMTDEGRSELPIVIIAFAFDFHCY